MPEKFEIVRNEKGGAQIEWRGLILTIQLNENYGIMGSVAGMDEEDGKLHQLIFHGQTRGRVFPLSFHEETMDPPKGGSRDNEVNP